MPDKVFGGINSSVLSQQGALHRSQRCRCSPGVGSGAGASIMLLQPALLQLISLVVDDVGGVTTVHYTADILMLLSLLLL